MKHFLRIFFLWPILLIFSCNPVDHSKLSEKEKKDSVKPGARITESGGEFFIDPEALSKDFMKWYDYTYYNIRLAQDFIGLGLDSAKITKAAFLNQLASGNLLAYKIKIRGNIPVYKLYKPRNPHQDIQAIIQQMAQTEIAHSNMEGRALPDYYFTDLNGEKYDRSTTKGKIVVIKCWFIHCASCIKEFPELNKLVDEYAGRNDIQFLSLAVDSKQDLVKFLNTKKFKYAVVAGQEKYMREQLSVTAYPTHLLINKNGKIVKVVNAVDELIPFLSRETGKTID